MGVLKMGTVALDGTKIHANASRHSALSYEHAGKIEAQLKAEVADLMAKAEAADAADIPDGMSIPDELARREERLRKLAEARAKIEARAKERHAREQAEHEAKMAARQAKAEATGKKPGGKPPEPPVEGPRPNDQINLTDEESRIMPVAGGGFDQCYNAQAAVAAGSLLVVASDVSQAPNDKKQLEPMLDKIEALARRAWASPNTCWRIPAISARRMSRLARRRGSNRSSPWAVSRIIRRWPSASSGAGSAGRSNAGRGDGASAEDAGRPGALRAAQADAGAGVRDHQIGAGIPSIFAARPRERARRMEPRDHGLEHEADVRPRSGLSNGLSRLALKIDIRSRSNCINPNPPTLRSRSIQAANRKSTSQLNRRSLSPTGC